MSVRWFGKKVAKKVELAAKRAINFGLAGAVASAKNNHSWTNRTGAAEGSVRIVETANRSFKGIMTGLWGSVNEPHVLFLEFGAKPHKIRARRPGGKLKFMGRQGITFRTEVNHPGNRPMPFLRPANRKIHKVLGKILKREFARA